MLPAEERRRGGSISGSGRDGDPRNGVSSASDSAPIGRIRRNCSAWPSSTISFWTQDCDVSIGRGGYVSRGSDVECWVALLLGYLVTSGGNIPIERTGS